MPENIIPIGPQHPLLKEPISLKIKVSGEQVLGGSLRIGFVHRGIERLAQDRTYIQNVHLIERICGICSHVHTTTYCYAVEKLLGIEIPPRAQYLRALMCELERIHSHLLWFGILTKHVGLDMVFMHSWHTRETVLDIMEDLSGGRVSHAANLIGGVRFELGGEQELWVRRLLQKSEEQISGILDAICNERSIQARTKDVAPITAEQIRQYCVVGPVARASGIDVDMRRDKPLPPYDLLPFKVITRSEGDAWARIMVRVGETRESLKLCKAILDEMPEGPVSVRTRRKVPEGEVVVRSEAPRGEVFYYLRSDGTEKPARLKIRTPTLSALSLLPLQLSEVQVADIPVVLAGIDLCIACADR
jgi:Ni,Fe-hydrogenase III large subunit